MRRIKKITRILLAAVMVMLSSVPVLAVGGGYTETEIPLPAVPANANATGPFVKSDGSMDYFVRVTNRQERGKSTSTRSHYRSSNGGKTWNKQDMSWAKDLELWNMTMDQNGAYYWLINGGDVELNDGEGYATFPYAKIIKVVDGKVQPIPNARLRSASFNYSQLLGVLSSGELAVLGTPWKIGGKHAICLVNPITGELKETEYAFSPVAFTDSVIGGFTFGAEKKIPRKNGYTSTTPLDKLVVYDRMTGKQTVLLSIQDNTKVTFLEDGSPFFEHDSNVLAADRDGTLYYAGKHGISRCVAGGSSFETVVDASKFSPEKNHMQTGSITAVNGKLYVRSSYYNVNNHDDPKNGTQKLFVYSPA